MLLYLLFIVVYIPEMVLSNEPSIIPFTIPSDLVQGANVKLMCSVSKGSQPLKFEWLFNGHTLVVTNDLFSQNLDDASILNIKNLKINHNGNYSCVVNNKHGRDVFTALLSINSIDWIKKPPEVLSIKETESINLDCIADGFPKVKTVWSKLNSPLKNSKNNPTSLEQLSLSNQQQLKSLPNGTLRLEYIQKSDEGDYVCTVDNGINEKLVAKTSITIQLAAKVSMIDNNGKELISSNSNEPPISFAKKGESHSIRCTATGDQPLSIDWFKEGKIMRYKFSTNMETLTSLTTSGLISELHFKKIDRDNSGVYECVARNDLSESKRSQKLVVLEVPEPPRNLQISELESTSTRLNWELGFNGNLDLTKINIYYWESAKIQSGNHKLNKVEIDLATSTWHVLKGLKSGTSYNVAVTCVNKLGESALSDTIKFETKIKNPVNSATDLMIKKVFSNKIKISWKYSKQDYRSSNLTGFQVFYKPIDEQNYYIERMTVKENEIDLKDQLHLTLINLKKNTKYQIKIKPFNKEGYGPDSEEIECQTLKGNLPNSPRITQHQIHSKSYLIVKWDYSPSTSNPTLNAALKHQEELGSLNNEHQHQMVPKTSSDDTSSLQDFDESVQYFMAYVEISELHMIVQTIPIPQNHHQVTIANLDKDVQYNIYISANNNYGESELSDPLTITIRSYQYEMNLFMAERNALIVTAISIGIIAILVSICCSVMLMRRYTRLAQQEKLRKMSTLTLSKFGTNKTTATYATIGPNAQPMNQTSNAIASNFQLNAQHSQLTPINTGYLSQPSTSNYQEIGLTYDLATGGLKQHIPPNLNQQQKTPRHQLSTFGHVTIRSDSTTQSERSDDYNQQINIKDRFKQSNKSLDSMKNMRNYDECIYDDALE